jgi:hypothetical protein
MKLVLTAVLSLGVSLGLAPLNAQMASAAAAPVAASAKGVLPAEAVQQVMPPAVFFSGQTATVQVRNSAVVRFGNGGLVLAGLVDTGGYSTSIREKYQFTLLADTALEVAGKRLAPGAYGCGFAGGSLLVMDLGGGDLLRTPTMRDAGLQRPRPLQMQAGKPGEYRLYLGREYIALRQAR